jgi:hypothetical protein
MPHICAQKYYIFVLSWYAYMLALFGRGPEPLVRPRAGTPCSAYMCSISVDAIDSVVDVIHISTDVLDRCDTHINRHVRQM